MSPPPKRKFLGDYKLGRTIGEGAFSKVKIGFHIETGQKVAIKIIDKKLAASKAKKAAEAAAKREARKTPQAVPAKAVPGGTATPSGTPVGGPALQPAPVSAPTGSEPAQPPSDGAKRLEEPERELHSSTVPFKDDVSRKKGAGRDTADGENPDQRGMTPSLVQRLSAEVQLLMRLDHPNIIRIYQVLESEDECFVIMEYAAGGELVDYIASKRYLSEKEARRFFRQMVSAIDHCHAAHVVHRDLKLENLLLNQDKNLLISDFGLGRTFSTHIDDYMKTFCGTPNYAAVELISGIPYIGMKADVWAMGVVLYIMTAGKPPFVGHSISSLYNKIKIIDYKCPDHFSPELKNLLKKVLVKDPNERISVEGIRNDPWVNFEEPGPPLRIEPKLSGKDAARKAEDPASLAKLISSITNDTEFIAYTFTQRSDLETRKQFIQAGQLPPESALAAKHLAMTRRRRSLAVPQTARARTSSIGAPDQAWLRQQKTEDDKVGNQQIVEEASELDAVAPLDSASTAAALAVERHGDLRSLNLTAHVSEGTSDIAKLTRALEHEPPRVPMRVRRHTSALDPESLSLQLARAEVAEMTASNVLESDASSIMSSTKSNRMNIRRRASTVASPMGDDKPAYDVGDFEVPGYQKSRPRRLSMDVLSLTAALAQQNARGGGATAPLSEQSERLASADGVTLQEIEAFHKLLRPAKKIRVGRFAFTVDTTSTEAPSTIFSEVHRALVDLQKTTYPTLRFDRTDPDYYLFSCRFSKVGEDVPPPSPALHPTTAPLSPLFTNAPSSQRNTTSAPRDDADTLSPPSPNASSCAIAERRPISALGSSSPTPVGPTSNILPITAQPEDDVVFEVEVCKLWLLKVHGIRIKRKWGSAFVYKEIYSMLIDRIHL